MTLAQYIAIDLGAESGRVMLGTVDRASGRPKLTLDEIHRFENVPLMMAGGLRWNLLQLWSDICRGVAKAISASTNVKGISADSWGVDYVLMGRGSPMLAPPYTYRDARNAIQFKRLGAELGEKFIFDNTGIQLISINTLYQLPAEPLELLDAAEAMLPIADYINHQLLGCPPLARCEISLASTTQLFDVSRRQWAWPLIDRVKIPRKIFPAVVDSGTLLGDCALADGAKVIATCSHDTACAVAAVPAENDGQWAYLSSGTWSLVGVELDQPIVNDRCLELGFTNELGLGGTTRLLKNISGLYMLQQCRQTWKAAGHDYSYIELASLAENATPLRSLIRPDSDKFGAPGDMPRRIADACSATGQSAPQEVGEFVRCIYESLALLYRKTLLELHELTGKTITRLHIVGGGSRAALLNQLTADACGIPVIAGPVEATSMGNVLIQARALGHITTPEIRQIVRDSSSLKTFEPRASQPMLDAYQRFVRLSL